MDAIVTSPALNGVRPSCKDRADVARSGHVLRIGRHVFKRAQSAEELEQVHRLNYQTFAQEVRQHPADGTGRLVDKFHDKSRYFIAVCGGRVVGMISAHDEPPFSTTARLPDPGVVEQPGMRTLEVRLLAVERGERHSTVFAGLIWSLYEHARAGGYTHLLISGVAQRRRLYERLGFRPLGAAVPDGDAEFVPMIMELGALPAEIHRDMERWQRRLARQEPALLLLPGPVEPSSPVRDALVRRAVSHRSGEFVETFERVRVKLAWLTESRGVGLFNGSGTLANDIVAAVLARGRTGQGSGLILVNGEFGRRLCGQASRFGLKFRTLEWSWGQAWDVGRIEEALRARPAWVWAVHLETSTGVLNDLTALVRLAGRYKVPVCVDCISSLGAVPLDLHGVHLATATSGKSLGSYAGVAMVFASPEALVGADARRLPAYLDLPEAVAATGPRFTFPSGPLYALEAALAHYEGDGQAELRYEHHRTMGGFVREQLRSLAVEPLAAEGCAAPVCTTFAPPRGESASEFLERCRTWGFELAGESAYLAARGWVQIATMGAVTREECQPLFEQWRRWQEEHSSR